MRVFDISQKEDFTQVAMEAIAPQINDVFVKEGLKYINDIYKDIDNKIIHTGKDVYTNCEAFNKFIKLVQRRFGILLKADPTFIPISPAAVIPMTPESPYRLKAHKSRLFNVGNIGSLLSDTLKRLSEDEDGDYFRIEKHYYELRAEANRILRQAEGKKGEISFKRAKISGVLSNIPCYLIVDIPFMKNTWKLTPEEMLAVITHEIGHCFDFISHMYLTETTNVTLANIIEALNKNDIEKAEYIYKTKFADKEEFKKYLQSDRTRLALTRHVVSNYVGRVASQLPNKIYNQTSAEAQADEFATRFGLGKPLTAALDKIHRRYHSTYTSGTLHLMVIDIILQMVSVAILALFLGGFSGVHFAIAVLVTILSSHPDNIDRTYDDPKDRFNRIKNNIAMTLKDVNLPEPVVRDLVEQHTYITSVIENTIEFPDVFRMIAAKIFPGGVITEKYIKLQKSLENVLNNVLFVKAAQIRTFEA